MGSKDIPETLYKLSTVYNTDFVYECIELMELKARLNEISNQEIESKKQDATKNKTRR